jgi:hypothetical protein
VPGLPEAFADYPDCSSTRRAGAELLIHPCRRDETNGLASQPALACLNHTLKKENNVEELLGSRVLIGLAAVIVLVVTECFASAILRRAILGLFRIQQVS